MKKAEHELEVHRPNILVADMERALRVYRDILGFKVNFLLDALDVAYEMFGLPREAKLRMAFVSEGKGAFGSLALTEARGVSLPRRSAPYNTCIIIEIKEGRLGGILEQLRAEGCEIGTAYELEQPTRTDVTVTDPDGNRLVLFEIHPRPKREIGSPPANPPAAG
jgi:catechol 2,3-dioxygenase-like lactoylglutathione lyase family enzyme